MSMTMTGRVAVVTGVASGIGAAIAAALRGRGITVVGVDLTPGAEERVDRLIVGDIADGATWEAVQAATDELGSWDVLVNNAAMQIEENLLDTTPETFEKVLSVNVVGAFRGLRAAKGRMGRGGSIVNIGSIVGFTADPLLGAYPTSKGAVINLTRTAALAFGPFGIRVNVVCPGSVYTPLTTRILDLADDPAHARARLEALHPLGEVTTAEEVAATVAFLASPESSGMSGSVVVVDKGITAANPEWSLSADIIRELAAEGERP